MKKRLRATVPKDVGFQGSNEDSALLLLREGRVLLLDGSSDSYAARTWVRCVRDSWRASSTGLDFIGKAQERYGRQVRRPTSWAQEGAFERGSFCTFLDIHAVPTRPTVEIRCVGDCSILFVTLDGQVRDAYPYQRAEQFNNAPLALCSDPATLGRQQELVLRGARSFSLSRGPIPTIVLATDALGAWLLTEDAELASERMRRLLALESPCDFHDLVMGERDAKAMRLDDATVIVLDVGGAG